MIIDCSCLYLFSLMISPIFIFDYLSSSVFEFFSWHLFKIIVCWIFKLTNPVWWYFNILISLFLQVTTLVNWKRVISLVDAKPSLKCEPLLPCTKPIRLNWRIGVLTLESAYSVAASNACLWPGYAKVQNSVVSGTLVPTGVYPKTPRPTGSLRFPKRIIAGSKASERPRCLWWSIRMAVSPDVSG